MPAVVHQQQQAQDDNESSSYAEVDHLRFYRFRSPDRRSACFLALDLSTINLGELMLNLHRISPLSRAKNTLDPSAMLAHPETTAGTSPLLPSLLVVLLVSLGLWAGIIFSVLLLLKLA